MTLPDPSGIVPFSSRRARPPDILVSLRSEQRSELSLRIVRIGRAAVLLQWGGDRLLTDPCFSQQSNPPGRYAEEGLGMGVDALPTLSGVLGSMDRSDHFDMRHFAEYRDHQVPVVVPAGTTQQARALEVGFSDVRALGPWETVRLGAFAVTAVCAKPGLPTTSLEYEHAYVVEVDGRAILFCAHLMTPEAQAEVAARFRPIDVAVVATNGLALELGSLHQLMSPRDAAALCRRLGVKVVVPIHYASGGNCVSNTSRISHPEPEALAEAARAQSPSTTVMSLRPGQRLDVQWGHNPRL